MTRQAYALSSQEMRELTDWASEEKGRLASRARAILLSAEGKTALRVAAELGLTVRTVYKWRQRFTRFRVAGLRDRARPGQPRRLPRAQREEIVRLTIEELPPQGRRWTIRMLAQECRITQHQVRKIWAENGLRPHGGRAALVDHLQASSRGVRLLGLFVSPSFSTIALQLGAQGVTALLGRRIPSREVFPLRALLREAVAAQPKRAFAESAGEFAAFVARIAERSERTHVHLVFSSPRPHAEARIASILAARSGLSASFKACLSTWADVVELWLEQAASAPREQAAVAQLAQAVSEELARSHARSLAGRLGERLLGLSGLGEPRATFTWLRRDAACAASSVGLLPAQGADL